MPSMEVANSNIVEKPLLAPIMGAENDYPNSTTSLKFLEVKRSEGRAVLISAIPKGLLLWMMKKVMERRSR